MSLIIIATHTIHDYVGFFNLCLCVVIVSRTIHHVFFMGQPFVLDLPRDPCLSTHLVSGKDLYIPFRRLFYYIHLCQGFTL